MPASPVDFLFISRAFRTRLRRRKNWQFWTQYLGGALLLGALGLLGVAEQPLFGDFAPGKFFLRKSHDWLHILEPSEVAQGAFDPSRFLLVFIDEESHAVLEQSHHKPWDRRLHAGLLDEMRDAPPDLVFFDVVFDQPGAEPEADQALAQMIAANGKVVLGAASQRIAAAEIAGSVQRILAPLADFRQPAWGWGMTSVTFDPADNSMRTMGHGSRDGRVPPAYWVAATKLDPAIADLPGGFERTRYLHYAGPPPAFPHISFSAAFEDDISFEDRLVFVGARHSLGFGGAGRDAYRSPYLTGDGEITGVELQATMVWNLLSRNWYRHTQPWQDTLIVLSFALVLAFVVNTFGPWGGTFSSLGLALAAAGASLAVAYTDHVFYAWLVPVLLQAPAALIWSTACNYYFETRQRRHLKRVFATYLAPSEVERLAEADEPPRLGGHEKVITPFFSDVEGFSAFAELLPPRDLAELLNEYLGAMTRPLQDEGGTLDKYIGDAIVAIFGAPMEQPDHAARACRAAVRLQQAQARLRVGWEGKGDRWPERVHHMRTRIGLNSGPAIVGNMGSEIRFNYTMTGDAVNLAARCEAAAKQYGVYIMVTGETREAALAYDTGLCFRQLDRCAVVGRQEAVEIFELLGLLADETPQQRECREHFNAGLKAYLAGNWTEAQRHFEAAEPLERWQPGRDFGIKRNPSSVMLG
ncbi:MAG: CHASE2 domain-containing protein, partial [Opitutales bacterium]